MIRSALSLGSVIALTACVSPMDLTPVQKMRVLQKQENQYQDTTMVIRSYKLDADGKRVEIGGVQCSAKNKWLSMPTVTTPAQIIAPTYLQADRFANGGQPPALQITCRGDGKSRTVKLDASSARGNTVVSSGGQYNAATGTYSNPTATVLTSRISSTLPWAYPSITVEF